MHALLAYVHVHTLVGMDISTEGLNSKRHTSQVVSVGTLWRRGGKEGGREREREREGERERGREREGEGGREGGRERKSEEKQYKQHSLIPRPGPPMQLFNVVNRKADIE